jgi:hypothetical protein
MQLTESAFWENYWANLALPVKVALGIANLVRRPRALDELNHSFFRLCILAVYAKGD